MDDAERTEYDQLFRLSFGELYLDDIHRANANDVRMGTFSLCAAFIDALSLAYSASVKVPNGKRGKWKRFMEDYFGAPYEPIWDSYTSYRSKLLHNFSPVGIAFTSSPEQAHTHLQRHPGYVLLHRESFVADVDQAFRAFAGDVRTDSELRARVFAWLESHPPLGLAVFMPEDEIESSSSQPTTGDT